MNTKLNSEDFNEMVKAQFEALKQSIDIRDFYKTELGFTGIWQEFGRQVFEKFINEASPQGEKEASPQSEKEASPQGEKEASPQSKKEYSPKVKKNTKKFTTTLGGIAIEKNLPFSEGYGGFKISPLLQENMVYVGHSESYEKGVEMLQKISRVKVSRAQLNRVTDYYGKQLTSPVNEERNLKPVLEKEYLYVEADASMVLTRDGDPRWKEVKLGRLFNSSDCIRMDKKPSFIKHSQYVAHMGEHTSFIEKMEPLIESFGSLKERLVFISDGAPWIRNWIEDSFPDATSILDFYHASQYLYEYANSVYSQDEQKVKPWAEEQKALLLESKLPEVMENIRELSPDSKAGKKILTYYTENQHRMDYKKYLSLGAGLIGSGAIESAHRTVVQKRMKLSGQRWSKRGAQNMLNLRVTSMNNRWDKVIQMFMTPKSVAA